jgi:RimJ/RimL family protein N-acetyltransferase
MKDIQTPLKDLTLIHPDPDRDAPFALSWFVSSHGKETLILMGNPEHKISVHTLEGEADIVREFLELEKANKQQTWMIRYDNKTIGAVWIELDDTKYVKSPALHIMIGDKEYRGKGFGGIIMREMFNYIENVLKAETLYSRHLVSNKGIAHLTESLGFTKDGAPYRDIDGLEFQNIRLEF